MPIIDMKKVYLLAHREEREKIFNLLHRLGLVELVDVKTGGSWNEFRSLLQPEQAAGPVNRLESELGEVRYCLDFLQRNFPVRKTFVEQFAGSKIALSEAEFSGYTGQAERVKSIYASCRTAEDDLSRIRNEETHCRNLLEELRPWADFTVPLEEVKNGSRTLMFLAAVPVGAYATLQEELAANAADYYREEVSAGRETVYCFFIFPAASAEPVSALFKSAAAAVISFPGLAGTPAAVARGLEQKLAGLDEERGAVLSRVEQLVAHRPLLMAYFDYLSNERAKQEAVALLGGTGSSFLLEGWVPAPALSGLEKTLAEKTETAVLVSRDPEKYEEVPVLLHNRGPAEAYEVVTRLYSVPSREELDPTPFLAPFFFVFFGICLSDAGYGLLLSLAALFLSRKMRLGGMGKQLINLLFLGGLSSLAFGILMGGYFGDLIKLPPLWFNPLDDPMRMLFFCFVFGLVHVYFGMGLQAYRSIRAGKPLHALFDQGFWFIFLNGLILLFLPEFASLAKWLALGGAAGLILTQGRAQKGLLKKALSGLLSLYNVTGYLSDVLSYSRLLALGLATGVIASAINTMGGLAATIFGTIFGTVVMVGLLLGGHLFNLVISTLGSYVHTSRLQYIEFFGKFFEGGGRAFRPFGFSARFVDVLRAKEAGHAGTEAAVSSPST
jgi:V/A-type H+-transporting ATPase subunit I